MNHQNLHFRGFYGKKPGFQMAKTFFFMILGAHGGDNRPYDQGLA